MREPKAFLFDEPLSNLDAALRVQMRVEIGELHQALKTTMIYVTHDQVEAMTMADKIVVLDRGSVAQVGSPLELYNRPNGLFVAGFIGSPTMNLIKGAPAAKRGATTIGIRPEHIDVSTTAGEWPATVRLAEHLGSDTFVYAEADGIGPLTLRLEGEAPLKPGRTFSSRRAKRTCIGSTRTAGGSTDGGRGAAERVDCMSGFRIMSVKLSAAALAHLPAGVAVPNYRRSDLSAGIVHIGVGNFHRAHQAVYLDDLFNAGRDHDWAIVGAGVRDAGRRRSARSSRSRTG